MSAIVVLLSGSIAFAVFAAVGDAATAEVMHANEMLRGQLQQKWARMWVQQLTRCLATAPETCICHPASAWMSLNQR